MRFRYQSILAVAALSSAFLAPSAQAKETERVIYKLPADFELGFSQKALRQSIREFVPRGQKVESWDKMVTVLQLEQTIPAKDFGARLMTMVTATCPGAKAGFVAGSDNESAGFMSYCPFNQMTRKPEWTFYLVTTGWESTYNVQMAFSNKPTAKDLDQMLALMKSVRVCEADQSDRDCRASKYSGQSIDWGR